MFLSRTGLRIGECLALQWEDIDFNTKSLHITKTLLSTTRTDSIIFDHPKNKNSVRTITIDISTLNLLKNKNRANQKYIKAR